MKLFVVYHTKPTVIIMGSEDSRDRANELAVKIGASVLCKAIFKAKYPNVFKEFYNNLK